MSKWNLIIDVANCTNCNVCVLACQDEHCGNSFPGYAAEMPKLGHRWIDIRQKVRGSGSLVDVAYLPVPCQHCDDGPCLKAGKDGAVTKRADGIVIIDPEKAKGQREIVDACPYGAIWWNEELQLPQHWIFDAHLLDEGWKEPRMQQVCATQAVRAVKVEDAGMESIAAEEGLEHLAPEHGTRPRVWYKNLHRYTKSFIAGSVEAEKGGVVDCVEGAKVTLSQDGKPLQHAETDNYGDFKFDGLVEDSGAYRITVEAKGHKPATLNVTLTDSVNLGAIAL